MIVPVSFMGGTLEIENIKEAKLALQWVERERVDLLQNKAVRAGEPRAVGV